MERDVFICHASEDKSDVVRPLVNSLQAESITCWVDEGEILWADSITQKVNEGLKISRYVIVVLSKSFMGKNWPKRELYAALNLEASSGEIKVLPLLVGDKATRDSIVNELPILNDKRYLTWEGQPKPIIEALLARLSRTRKEALGPPTSTQAVNKGENIPLPKMRRNFTQRDRDLFLKETFTIIKQYFQRALSQLQDHYSDVETEFMEIHATKFIAKIYYRGDVKAQCKIWIGGLTASDGIGYSESRFQIDADNSFNELVSVCDDGFELKLNTMMDFMSQPSKNTNLSPLEMAQTLWMRFSSQMERL
jgi:hypothetical protein